MIIALLFALVGLGLLIGTPSGGSPAGVVIAALTSLGARPVAGMNEMTHIGLGSPRAGRPPLAPSPSFDLTTASFDLLRALAVAPTAVAWPLYFHGSRAVGAGAAAVLPCAAMVFVERTVITRRTIRRP